MHILVPVSLISRVFYCFIHSTLPSVRRVSFAKISLNLGNSLFYFSARSLESSEIYRSGIFAVKEQVNKLSHNHV